jgi:hypothetical protein
VLVAVEVIYRNVSLEQYSEAIEIMGLLPGGPPPPGVLLHCMTTSDEGIRIFDVWESREALTEFQDSVIAPVFRRVGALEPPETHVFDIQNYYVANRHRWPSIGKLT